MGDLTEDEDVNDALTRELLAERSAWAERGVPPSEREMWQWIEKAKSVLELVEAWKLFGQQPPLT